MKLQRQIWQDIRDGKWRFVIREYHRVTFKTSKRIGWKLARIYDRFRGEKFGLFDTRALAMAKATEIRAALMASSGSCGPDCHSRWHADENLQK